MPEIIDNSSILHYSLPYFGRLNISSGEEPFRIQNRFKKRLNMGFVVMGLQTTWLGCRVSTLKNLDEHGAEIPCLHSGLFLWV